MPSILRSVQPVPRARIDSGVMVRVDIKAGAIATEMPLPAVSTISRNVDPVPGGHIPDIGGIGINIDGVNIRISHRRTDEFPAVTLCVCMCGYDEDEKDY